VIWPWGNWPCQGVGIVPNWEREGRGGGGIGVGKGSDEGKVDFGVIGEVREREN